VRARDKANFTDQHRKLYGVLNSSVSGPWRSTGVLYAQVRRDINLTGEAILSLSLHSHFVIAPPPVISKSASVRILQHGGNDMRCGQETFIAESPGYNLDTA
jgi:hypothetical protein